MFQKESSFEASFDDMLVKNSNAKSFQQSILYSSKTHKRKSTSSDTKPDLWGAKAAKDFRNLSGKNFRHEKTKKKRGSYLGGKIDTSINSIKFAN
jgi:hypothetical protein